MHGVNMQSWFFLSLRYSVVSELAKSQFLKRKPETSFQCNTCLNGYLNSPQLFRRWKKPWRKLLATAKEKISSLLEKVSKIRPTLLFWCRIQGEGAAICDTANLWHKFSHTIFWWGDVSWYLVIWSSSIALEKSCGLKCRLEFLVVLSCSSVFQTFSFYYRQEILSIIIKIQKIAQREKA